MTVRICINNPCTFDQGTLAELALVLKALEWYTFEQAPAVLFSKPDTNLTWSWNVARHSIRPKIMRMQPLRERYPPLVEPFHYILIIKIIGIPCPCVTIKILKYHPSKLKCSSKLRLKCNSVRNVKPISHVVTESVPNANEVERPGVGTSYCGSWHFCFAGLLCHSKPAKQKDLHVEDSSQEQACKPHKDQKLES